jgi:hypothetical protein
LLAALNKKIMWLIVAWFAILQTVSPFIHGHMGVDTPAQGHGLHMHIQELAQFDKLKLSATVHTLHSANINTHTIGVDNGMLESINPLILLPLFAVLFVLFSFSLAIKWLKPNASPSTYLHLLLHSQSTPRAPPL